MPRPATPAAPVLPMTGACHTEHTYEHGQLTVDRLWAYAYDRLGELTAARGLRQVPMRDAQNRTFPIAGPRL